MLIVVRAFESGGLGWQLLRRFVQDLVQNFQNNSSCTETLTVQAGCPCLSTA